MYMCVNKRVELAQRGLALYKIDVLLLLKGTETFLWPLNRKGTGLKQGKAVSTAVVHEQSLDGDMYQLQSAEASCFHLNAGISFSSSCIAPVNTAPLGGQVDGFRERSHGRWGLELRAEPCLDPGQAATGILGPVQLREKAMIW